MHVQTVGARPRVVFVHGSIGNGALAWAPQQPLADRFTLVIVNRGGYPPGPPAERIDFETYLRGFLGIIGSDLQVLVVSGGHHAAFDAVCDVLEERLPAERAVLPGAGHGIPRAPGFNERLVAFLERA